MSTRVKIESRTADSVTITIAKKDSNQLMSVLELLDLYGETVDVRKQAGGNVERAEVRLFGVRAFVEEAKQRILEGNAP